MWVEDREVGTIPGSVLSLWDFNVSVTYKSLITVINVMIGTASNNPYTPNRTGLIQMATCTLCNPLWITRDRKSWSDYYRRNRHPTSVGIDGTGIRFPLRNPDSDRHRMPSM